MNPDLYIVRKVNEATSISRKASLFMDLVTRYGHWAFVIYGLLLWLAPGGNRKERRLCCVLAFLGVVIASLLSFAIGKVWRRRRPFERMPGSHLLAAFAGLLAFSRIFAGVHYPTDLLGGVAIAGLVHRLIHGTALASLASTLAAFGSTVSDWIFKK